MKEEPHQARIHRAKISYGDENFKKTGFCAETGKEDRAEYKKGALHLISKMQRSLLIVTQ